MVFCLGMRRGGEEFGESGVGWGRGLVYIYGLVGLGFCGNFNGDTIDDFIISMGIVEGIVLFFVDFWRVGNCLVALEREIDFCFMS